jgi:hypothetical protein
MNCPDAVEMNSARQMTRGIWASISEEDIWMSTLESLASNQGKWKDNFDGHIAGTGIPKIIHFIWLGRNPIPKFAAADNVASDCCASNGLEWNECMLSWRTHHPASDGWTIHLWTDRDIIDDDTIFNENDLKDLQLHASQLHNLKGFKHAINIQHYALASDILRLEILNAFGGLYVDVDYWCVQSLDAIRHINGSIAEVRSVLSPLQFFCGESNTGCVELNNGIMACCRGGHPIVWEMMQAVETYYMTLLSEDRAQQMNTVQSLMSSFLDSETMDVFQVSQNCKVPSPMNVIEHTGPGLLTRKVFRWLCDEHRDHNTTSVSSTGKIFDATQVMVFKKDVFHPFPNHLRHDCSSKLHRFIVPDVTIAVHLWGCSWQGNP